jgi:hypothetical protein
MIYAQIGIMMCYGFRRISVEDTRFDHFLCFCFSVRQQFNNLKFGQIVLERMKNEKRTPDRTRGNSSCGWQCLRW